MAGWSAGCAYAAEPLPSNAVTLFEAAKAGDSGAVQALLRDGADVNAREPGDHTYALHWAAAAGLCSALV